MGRFARCKATIESLARYLSKIPSSFPLMVSLADPAASLITVRLCLVPPAAG